MIQSSFLATLLAGSRPRLVVGAILVVAIPVSLLNLLWNAGHQADTVVADRSDALNLNTLAPELEEAEVISLDDLNQSQRQKIASVDGISFRFEGDFNDDEQQDLMLLGRHLSNGMPSSFLLVATREPAGWARAQLLTFEHNFVIGRMYESGLAVFFCVGCDYGGHIRWTGSQYAFEPLALAAACIENSEAVEVRAYRLPEGPPAYAFMVINNADAPIRGFRIGGHPFILINRDNIPTSVGTPTGWEGNYFFEDNHPVQYMQFLWEAEDPEMRILPGTSLSGFSIQLPYPISTEQRPLFGPEGHPEYQIDLWDIPFEVWLNSGTCYTGSMSME